MNNEKIFKIILQGLFFLSLASLLVVDQRLFFPFATGSALFFRLITEALFLSWIIFALVYPKYRPKFNILTISIGIYILALILSTIFSVNSYLSFWGDAERMMGLFGILHFFALFLAGTSIFKEKKDLKLMLNVFLGISSLICIYGIAQRLGITNIKPGEVRIVATVGNAGILAAYLIFGLFLSAYSALIEKKNNFKIIYGFLFLLHLIAVFLTGTRGAYLGIIIGFLFSFFIILPRLRNKKILQKSIFGGIILIIILYGFLFINQNKDWVNNNSGLYRLTHFSLSDVTAKTRLMSWDWGLKGFKEKPILGYGLEQYAIPYNKYFSSEYYNYAASKPYFDRAHNIVIEFLATLGIFGLLSYLFLLFAMVYKVFKDSKKENNYIYLGIIGGLILAYFTQNLFIFDTLPAMLGFSVLLVLIHNNSYDKNCESENNHKNISLNIYLVAPLAFIFLLCFIYSFNNFIKKPYFALRDNAIGQALMPSDYNSGIYYLKKSVNSNTILDLDLRSATANTILNYYRDNNIENENKKEDIIFAVELYKDNLKYLPNDAYYNYKTAEILDYEFAINLDEYIIPDSRFYIDRAILNSPGRARLYYILAENLFMSGDIDKAVETAEYAVSLNDKFGESYWQLAHAYYEKGELEKIKENIKKSIDLGYRVNEETILSFAGLFDIYKSIDNEIEFLELVIKNGTKNYIYYSTLATRYYEKGNKEKAIEYAEKSVKFNPETKESVDKFIKKVNEL